MGRGRRAHPAAEGRRRLRDLHARAATAGLPVSILKSFSAPEPAAREDEELLRERVASTATGLLTLLGVDADPLQSREHILVSTILADAWKKGEDLDLAALIGRIQSPPFRSVGVLDLESFFPAKERFALAMRLNNLLAAPGFAAWLEGEPLDIGRSALHTPEGKPRVAIFSIAHLGDAERMFFVTLLLNQMLGWMRAQSGHDEPAGDPLHGRDRRLLSAGREPAVEGAAADAAEAGARVRPRRRARDAEPGGPRLQGPVEHGHLVPRAAADRARQGARARGLEGVAAGAAQKFDRGQMEQLLAGLGNRVFLMNNVHEDAPVVFETRWALSYLRGPLTRAQIKTLMDPRRSARAEERRAGRGRARVRPPPPPPPPGVGGAGGGGGGPGGGGGGGGPGGGGRGGRGGPGPGGGPGAPAGRRAR